MFLVVRGAGRYAAIRLLIKYGRDPQSVCAMRNIGLAAALRAGVLRGLIPRRDVTAFETQSESTKPRCRFNGNQWALVSAGLPVSALSSVRPTEGSVSPYPREIEALRVFRNLVLSSPDLRASLDRACDEWIVSTRAQRAEGFLSRTVVNDASALALWKRGVLGRHDYHIAGLLALILRRHSVLRSKLLCAFVDTAAKAPADLAAQLARARRELIERELIAISEEG